LNLPPDFIHTIENTYGEDGKQLITNLPSLIEEACALEFHKLFFLQEKKYSVVVN